MDIKANALLEGLRKLKDEIRQERIKRKYRENSPTLLIRETKENTMENDKTDQEKLRRHKNEEHTENKRESEDDDNEEDQNEVRKNTEFKEKIKQIWIEENIDEKIREQLEKFKECKELEKDVDKLPNLSANKLGNLDDTAQDSLDIENVYDNEIQDDQDFRQDNNHKTNEDTVVKNTNSLETMITEMTKVFKGEIDTDNEIEDEQDFPQVNTNHETNKETNEETVIKNTDSLETLITEMNKVFKQEIDILLNKKTS
uniref:Uncharacterized protein n=1 Tax=Cacopsylla melanoneura TaxID=428564 RepID=A0A8D9BRY1_9HEMI